MRAIMVMFDSLSRRFLEPYGCDFTYTPNFKRLAEKSIRFDKFYVGSMPCIPARRELHTGRYNFLHRSWGPLEPFDDSMPEILKKNGVYTHLVTDHYHYLEDGGATYHNRYSSWELFRGQEGDFWKGEVADPEIPECEPAGMQKALLNPRVWRQDWVNRKYFDSEEKMPQSQTFEAGLKFIETNCGCDNWFLQIETFDPHEPFFAPEKYRQRYPHNYTGKHLDWPPYGPVCEDAERVEHLKAEYSALVSMCDAKLGLVLDVMDTYAMWEDTMLIVNTDHGFLTGEHNWWAKGIAPLYNEVANTPFFVYDPRTGKSGFCDKLAQMIDLAPTLLEYFGVEIPSDMQGKVLGEAYEHGRTIHESVIYGYFGGSLNLTEGRYTYMRAPVEPEKVYEYTLMPTNMTKMFSVESLADAELYPGFSFTKGTKVLKVKPNIMYMTLHSPINMLFDLKRDDKQEHPIIDYETEAEMCNRMRTLMTLTDVPPEQFKRMGFHDGMEITPDMIRKERESRKKKLSEGIFARFPWNYDAKELFNVLVSFVPPERKESFIGGFEKYAGNLGGNIDIPSINRFLAFIAQTPGITELQRLSLVFEGYVKVAQSLEER